MPLFPEEHHHRAQGSAAREVDVLLAHLRVSDEVRATYFAAEQLEPLLRRWATEVALNLEWYAVNLAKKQRARVAGVVAVSAISVAALGALAAVTIAWHGADGAALGAQAGFVLTAIFLALQILTSVTDVKAQLGIFWEASANLKEALYSFEEQWTGVEWTRARAIAFKTALRAQIALARLETRRERAEYFKTLKSPSEVVSAGLAALEQLRGKQREVYEQYKISQAADAHLITAAKNDVEIARVVHERAVRRLEDATFANDHASATNVTPAYDQPAIEKFHRDVDEAAAKLEEARAHSDMAGG